jgi:hypothetical protein
MLGKEKKEKVSAEVVDAEFDEICEFYRIDTDVFNNDDDKETADKIKFYMRKGFLTFNKNAKEGKGAFTYKLWSPVMVANKELTEITMSNMGAEHFINMEKSKGGDITKSLRIIAACSGEPLGVIQKLYDKDIAFLGVLISFFVN